VDDINRGIIHCGRYERFMHLLKRIFRILIGNEIINDLFNSSGEKERKILFDQKWNNVRWRLFCRVFFKPAGSQVCYSIKNSIKYIDPLSLLKSIIDRRSEEQLLNFR